MLELDKLLTRRAELEEEMDSIRGYVEHGDYDRNLEDTWYQYELEMKDVTHRINILTNPELSELEETRLALKQRLRDLEDEIVNIQDELNIVEVKQERLESTMKPILEYQH